MRTVKTAARHGGKELRNGLSGRSLPHWIVTSPFCIPARLGIIFGPQFSRLAQTRLWKASKLHAKQRYAKRHDDHWRHIRIHRRIGIRDDQDADAVGIT
jgi:hypothetical protein